MCGASGQTSPILVEGARMNACSKCSRFGKALSPQAVIRTKIYHKFEEPTKKIVSDYNTRIRIARETKKLTQEEFAILMTEKVSLLHKIESGHQEPSLDLARKLEKKLHIVLLENIQKEATPSNEKKKNTPLTLGDLINEKLGKTLR